MANLPALTPTTFTEAMTFADALAKSTMVPPAFQRNPANILVAIQWGAEIGLGPLQALQNIAVINGRPAVYGDAMLALVRGSPVCQDVIERFEGETAVCEAHRKGAAPVVARFSVADARRAGLWDKAGPWKQYPQRMLQMRARGFALRDAFPDVLRGIISAEEAADIPREAKDITPADTPTVAAELDAFAAPAEPDQADTDTLVAAAWVHARDGHDTFRAWYLGLTDDQRIILRPHMPRLRTTAAAVDEPPSEEAPEPIGSEDAASATPNEASEGIPVITPQRLYPGKARSGWNWAHYAEELLTAALSVDPADIDKLRVANGPMLNALRQSDAAQWTRVEQALADCERREES